ncbi:MAG: exopolyphosphatase/guanosine-5'-triphosphate,3'-diphosphate pyrophosphatase [Paracoccaceae bacterium]
MVGKLLGSNKLKNKNNLVEQSIFLDENVNSLTRVGTIDVGSNSIRMVVFDGAARSPSYFFNENIFCGLGDDMDSSGNLGKASKERAFLALSRFSLVAKAMEISPVLCIATAAIRDANDGVEFCNEVFLRTGLELKILSGIEEAKLSAQGVFLGWPEATGIMCDIGGSSLELAEIGDGLVGQCSSFPLGPLKLMNLTDDQETIQSTIDKNFYENQKLLITKGKDLFLVGGSWRAIARLDMERQNYPLRVLHEYKMTQQSVLDTVDWILSKGSCELKKLTGMSNARLRLVPIASIVLRALLKRLKPRSISISSYGVREGLLYEQMPYQLKRCDPLLEACRLDEQQNARIPGFGSLLFIFIKPLFKDISEGRLRLIKAACLLHDVNWRAHPDYRAEVCFDNATRANLGGLSHVERVFLGISLLHRYKNSRQSMKYKDLLEILSNDELKEAEILGKAMRFGAMFSTVESEMPARLLWDSKRGILKLTMKAEMKALYGEVVAARFLSLAEALKAKTEII